jgi:hypothetical protein
LNYEVFQGDIVNPHHHILRAYVMAPSFVTMYHNPHFFVWIGHLCYVSLNFLLLIIVFPSFIRSPPIAKLEASKWISKSLSKSNNFNTCAYNYNLFNQFAISLRCHQITHSIDQALTKALILNDTPKLFERLKCESQMKTTKKGVGVRSVAHNISGVKNPCWSSRMGIKMNDKRVSYGATQTKQVGQCIVKALLAHGWAMGIHGITRLTTI